MSGDRKNKYPIITVNPNGMKTKELSFLLGRITDSLDEIYEWRGVVHRTMTDNGIIIEVKNSGIKA